MAKKQLKVSLIIPDVHVPYHDRTAFALMLKAARDLKLDGIRVLGDFADFYTVSAHSKDPRRANKLDWELKEVNKALTLLDGLKAKDKIFISGNHEDRLLRYLQDRAPELYEQIKVETLFRLKRRGWKFVPYKEDTTVGHMHYTHDLKYTGRNAVFRCLDTYQHSNITGHTHRFAYIVEGTAIGGHKLAAQFGWLGDVEQVDYLHKAQAKKDWALGFGIEYHDPKTSLVYVVPVPILVTNGVYTCLVNGKLYSEVA